MSPEDFKQSLIQMKEENFDENLLSQILHYMPTSEELNQLRNIDVPLTELHEAEKFASMVWPDRSLTGG